MKSDEWDGDRKVLRVGILGAAKITVNALIRPSKSLNCIRLVAVAARDRRRAEEFALNHGIEKVLETYDEVINDSEVDAIYNPLPNGLHAYWNLKAIKAGKAVLSEKPSANNAMEAVIIEQSVISSGVPFMEAFHYRYHPLISRMLHLSQKTVGEIISITANLVVPAPANSDARWDLDLGGGSMMDLGCYSIHVMRTFGKLSKFGGEPVVVRGTCDLWTDGVDSRSNLELKYPNGCVGHAVSDMDGNTVSFTLKIEGTEGSLFAPNFIAPHEDDRLVITSCGSTRTEHVGLRSTYEYQLEEFCSFCGSDGKKEVLTNASDATLNMRMIDNCYTTIGLHPRPSQLT